MSKAPAFPAPAGVTPNFGNPPSIGWRVSAISLPFTCLATVFVLLRLYARAIIVKSVGIDDIFIIIAMLVSWSFCALGLAAMSYGYGVDLWNLYASNVAMFLKLDLGGQVAYFVGTLFLKLSILLFYLRINPDQIFRRIVYAIGIFDIVYILLSCCIAIFGCKPLAGGWDITIASVCVNKKAYYYAQAIFNIVTDFATLFLPIKMCLELQLPTKQRWMLGSLFAVGSFACIVSIIRLVTMIPSFHSIDFTVFKVQVAGWAEVEINVGIVCACLPCMKPILNRHLPSLMKGSTKDSSARTPNSHSLNNYVKSKSYQMSNIDPDHIREAHRLSSSANSEQVAEGIRNKIRGWSGKGESNAEVRAQERSSGEGGETDSIRRIWGKGGNGESNEGDVGDVVKTVVYDIRYGKA